MNVKPVRSDIRRNSPFQLWNDKEKFNFFEMSGDQRNPGSNLYSLSGIYLRGRNKYISRKFKRRMYLYPENLMTSLVEYPDETLLL